MPDEVSLDLAFGFSLRNLAGSILAQIVLPAIWQNYSKLLMPVARTTRSKFLTFTVGTFETCRLLCGVKRKLLGRSDTSVFDPHRTKQLYKIACRKPRGYCPPAM
jgi:hypothetical protein